MSPVIRRSGGLPNRPTMSVPEAGKLLGLSRGSAYQAARRGDLPTLRVGRRLLVPTDALRALLTGTSTQ